MEKIQWLLIGGPQDGQIVDVDLALNDICITEQPVQSGSRNNASPSVKIDNQIYTRHLINDQVLAVWIGLHSSVDKDNFDAEPILKRLTAITANALAAQ